MNQTQAHNVADSLTHAQKYALRTALCKGEEYRQKNGGKRLSPKRCEVTYAHRSSITAATRRSLAKKVLMEGDYFGSHLTPDGIKVAKLLIEDWFEDEDGSKPKTVEEYVATYLALREDRASDHASKVREARRLWRGLSTRHYTGRRRTLSAQIAEEFANDSYRDSIDLDLDDLIDLGKQIEKLR